MLYTLLPNPLYSFDSNGNMYFKNKLLEKNKTNNIVIKLYDIDIVKPVSWFFNVAKYNIWLPPECQNRINEIEFIKFGRIFSKKYEYYIGTKTPIIYKEKYAIPLSCPNIAISKEGEIIFTTNGEIFKRTYNKYSNSEYECVYINNSKQLMHRLMLDAWSYNTDPKTLVMGNHIDGNKLNNKLDNLEWISHSGNVRHAIKIGLRKDNIEVKIKHYNSDDILYFNSINDACKYIQCYDLTVGEINKLVNGKTIKEFEIKLLSDTTDWFYKGTSNTLVSNKSRFKFILYKNKTYINTFYNLKDLSSYFNTGVRYKIDRWIKYCEDNGYLLKIENLINTEGYELYNLTTNEIKHILDVDKICNLLETTKTMFYNRMRFNKPRLINNYIICIGSNNNFKDILNEYKLGPL